MWPSLQSVVQKLSPSKGRKRVKRNLADELDSEDDAKDEKVDLQDITEHTSFNQADKDFLLQLTTVMATTTDSKIQEAVMPLRNEVADLKKALTTSMLPEVDRETLKRELREEILKELQVGPPPGLDSQSSSDLSSAQDPSEITWVLGSLGRNLDQQEAMERARQALATAGCEQPDDMFAPYGLGSQVHVRFLTAAKAGRTRMQLRQRPTKFDGESSQVWLDLKKSRAERLPKMLLKELEKGILEIKNAMSHDWSVIRCGSTKKVYVNKVEVVRLERNNTVTWQDESPVLPANRKELTARIAVIANR